MGVMKRCRAVLASALKDLPLPPLPAPAPCPRPCLPCPCPQLAAVRKSMEAVKQMVAQIQPAAAWAQGNLAVYQQQAAGLRAQVCAALRSRAPLACSAAKQHPPDDPTRALM